MRQQETQVATNDLSEVVIPDVLRENMALFLGLVRRVLSEYSEELRATFDTILSYMLDACAEDTNSEEIDKSFEDTLATITKLDLESAQILMRAFAAYFHLANVAEENYRVQALRSREAEFDFSQDAKPLDALSVGTSQSI